MRITYQKKHDTSLADQLKMKTYFFIFCAGLTTTLTVDTQTTITRQSPPRQLLPDNHHLENYYSGIIRTLLDYCY